MQLPWCLVPQLSAQGTGKGVPFHHWLKGLINIFHFNWYFFKKLSYFLFFSLVNIYIIKFIVKFKLSHRKERFYLFFSVRESVELRSWQILKVLRDMIAFEGNRMRKKYIEVINGLLKSESKETNDYIFKSNFLPA